MEFRDPVQHLHHFLQCAYRALGRAHEDLRLENRPVQENSLQYQARDLKRTLRRARRRLQGIDPLMDVVAQVAISKLDSILTKKLAVVEDEFEPMAPTSAWVQHGQQVVSELQVELKEVQSMLPQPS